MGFLGRFEKKVEGAVSGVFARAFKGDVQPVEIAARLQRELDTEAKLMSRDKRLVPNEFVVNLSQHDHDKLVPYSATLTTELAGELRRHAGEMGYVFNGPIRIHFELDEALPVGRFTVSSEAVAGVESSRPWSGPHRDPGSSPLGPTAGPPAAGAAAAGPAHHRAPSADRSPYTGNDPDAEPPPLYRDEAVAPAESSAWNATVPRPARHQLVLEVNGTRHPLTPPGFVIGRGTEADLRINDPGVSRMHAEIRVRTDGPEESIDIVDLGSTNGIVVDGQKVRQSPLSDGSRIEIGSTRMLVHAPSGR
ncbi:DUF3662 and FHA domain-containing protein [Microlunatus ginsengisoli]|uniref:Antibiotic biosynthesis regulator FhaA n=1 Tax=Microlunatus ginsengisoli TaxID=363863 RepID=A0ABP7ACR3_9ACTN